MKLKFRMILKANPDNVTIQEGKKIILAQQEVELDIKDVSNVLVAKKMVDLEHEFVDEHIEVEIEKL